MAALEGMRVLDLTQYEAGTSCTQTLAWLGADVVKVEPPSGDPGRSLAHGARHNQYFFNFNGNKRSVVLDLARPRGRELLLEMASHYDVFVENYGPGVIEKLDIGYDAMRKHNPSIIYGRIKGFGLSGPYADYKVYDSIAMAAAGIFSLNGEPDGPPLRPGSTFADTGTGLQMAIALLAAYAQRLRTGKGEFIEISMQEAVTMFIRTIGLEQWASETPALRRGNRGRPPSSIYPCKGDGPNDYVHITVVTQRMWDCLCSAIGQPELAVDPRFATTEARNENSSELYDIIAEWTRTRTKHEAWHALAKEGVPSAATLDTSDIWKDPHLEGRDFLRTVEHPTEGTVHLLASPMRLAGTDVPLTHAPLLGQHTDEVLRADLGLSDEALAELRAHKTIL